MYHHSGDETESDNEIDPTDETCQTLIDKLDQFLAQGITQREDTFEDLFEEMEKEKQKTEKDLRIHGKTITIFCTECKKDFHHNRKVF